MKSETKDRALLVEFGKRIQKLRQEKGWSQEEFAQQVGLHRTYIGAIERGERNVALINIGKIAKGLDTPIFRLFKNDD